jgi:hypothetical protein
VSTMSLPSEPVVECSGLKRNGEKCTVTIITPASLASGDPRCWVHDDRVTDEQKQQAVIRGAATVARTLRRRPDSPNPALRTREQIQAYIEDTAGKHDRGEILARDVVARDRTADVALKAYAFDLGEELAELERLAAAQARAVRWR